MRFGFGVPCVLDACGAGKTGSDGVVAVACHPSVHVAAFLSRSSLQLWSSGANVVFLGSIPIPGTGLGKDDDGATHIVWQQQGKAISVATRHRRILFFDADVVLANSDVFTANPPTACTCSLSNVAPRIKFRTEVRINYGIITGLTNGGRSSVLAITSGGFVCCVGWHRTQLIHAWNTVFLSSAQHSIEFDPRAPSAPDFTSETGNAWGGQGMDKNPGHTGKVPATIAPTLSNTQLQVHATKESVYSGTIVSVAFHSALQLLALTLSDGFVALLEGLSDERVVYGDTVSFKGSCVRVPSVAKVAINGQHRLLAAATLGGGVSCKRIDPKNFSLTQFWSSSRWCEEQRNFGPVSDLMWSPDEDTLLVSYHHHGIVLLHFSGVCLLSTFSRYDVGTPGSFTMRSSEPSFSDYDKKNASSPVLSRGCTSVCWDPNGYRVYAVEAASRSAYVLPLTQVVSSSEVCSVAQYSPIAMFDGSRLYLSHCSSREGTEGEWEIAPCPPLYLQKGYPLAYCEVSSDGEHIVCAGALGFAFFHRRVRRWRVPPLDRVCASVVCVAAPAWIRNEAVVLPVRCCTNQNNFELQVYSRFLPSNRELLAKTPLGRKPIMVRTSTGESSRGWIVVLTTANDMIFYQFNLKSDHLFAPHEVSVTLSYITRVDLHERIQRPLEVLCVPPHDHSATIATPYPTGRGRAASTHNTNSTATGSNPRLPQKHLDAGQGAGAGMRASFFSLPSLYILQRNHHLVAISYCNDSGASEGVGGGNTRDAQTGKHASNEISAVSNGEAAEAKSTTTREKGKSQSSFGWGGFSSWGAVPTSAAGEKQSHSTPPGHFTLISVCNEPVYRVWRDASAPVEGASLLVFGNSGLSCVVVREQNSSTNDNKNNNNSTLYCKYKFNLSPLDGDMVPLGVSVYDGYIVMGTEGRVRHGFATVWQDRVFPHFTVSTKRALFQHTSAIAAIADGFNIPTTPVNPTSSRRANGDSLFEKSGRAVKEGARGVSSSAAGDHAEGPRGGISQASKPERDESSAYGNIHDVARAPSIGPLYALGSGFVTWLESMRENGTFTPIMDYMLHYITSEKDSMNIRFVDDRSVVLQLISFLRLYPEFHEIVIGFVRKIDALQWQMVLDVVGSPVDFFFECVAVNRLKEAAQLVRIIMMGEGPLLESVLNRLKQQGGLPSLAQVSESANDGKANASNTASLASDLTLTRSPQMQLLEATALCAQHLFIVVMRNRDFQGAFEVLRFTAMLQNELSVDSSKPQPPPATQTSVPHRSQENLKRSTSTRDRADSPAKLERSFTNGDAVAAASYSSATGTSAAAAEPAQSSMFTRALRSVGILASPEEAAAFFPVETGEIFAQLSSPDLAGVGSEKVSNQSEVQVGASSTSTHPKGEALQGNLSMTHHKVDDTLESQIGTVAGTPFKFFGRDVAMSTQARRGSCSIFQFLCLPQHKPLLAEIENASTDLLFAGCLSQLEDLLDIFSIDALYFLKAMSMSLPQLPMAPVLPQEPENAPDASKPSVDPSETTAAGNPKPNAESSAAPQPEDETRIADCNVVDRPLNAILLFDALHDEYGLPRCPGKPQEPHVHPELPPPFFQAQSLERTAAQLGTSEKGLAAGGAEGGDVASLEDAQQQQQQQREEEQRRAERRQAVTAILRKMTTTTQEYLSHNPAVFEKLVRMRRLMTEAEIPEYQMALSMLCLDASDVATLANTYPSLRDALGELATHPCYAGYQPFVTLCLSL